MPKRIIRVNQLYGRNGVIPVGPTKFYEDFVHHPGGEENVPGTNVPRLKLVSLGDRAKGAFEDESDALVEALRAHRNSALTA